MPGAPPSGMFAALRHEADKQAWVDWLFDHVAERYDLGNDIMSVGWHTRWKRRLVEEYLELDRDFRVLDLACGTGDVTFLLAPHVREVVGSDINPAMMDVAKRKQPTGLDNIDWQLDDAGNLPYDDNSFDVVTCVYAGRGFPDFPAVVSEVYRVLKPGGHFWNLDFARPRQRWWDRTYRGYMMASGAVLGSVLHGDPKSYMYIPASMRAYPGQHWLDGLMKEAGFRTEVIETVGSIMAYNHGMKPR